MKRMLLFLMLAVGMLNAHEVVAQRMKDYVITMKGDTIYGEITSVKSKKVKILVNGEKRTYFPPQIYRIYHYQKLKQYASSYIKLGMEKIKDSDPKMYVIKEKVKLKKPLFTEILHDGDIIVYNFIKSSGGAGMMGAGGTMSGFSSSTDYYYALKRSTGEITELKKSGFFLFGKTSKKEINGNLIKMIADEPELIEKLQNEEKLNYDMFIDYIRKYNVIKKAKQVYPIEIF